MAGVDAGFQPPALWCSQYRHLDARESRRGPPEALDANKEGEAKNQ